jgi:hypothetical protein
MRCVYQTLQGYEVDLPHRALKFLFTKLDWRGKALKKIDNLVLQRSVWCDPKNVRDRDGHFYIDNLQTVYVPLRELARHFDGYSHVWIKDGPNDEFPLLKIPHEANIFNRSSGMIRRQMQATQDSEWTEGNTFTVPNEWVETSIALYRKTLHSIITTTYECHGKGVQFTKENLEAVIAQTHCIAVHCSGIRRRHDGTGGLVNSRHPVARVPCRRSRVRPRGGEVGLPGYFGGHGHGGYYCVDGTGRPG